MDTPSQELLRIGYGYVAGQALYVMLIPLTQVPLDVVSEAERA
jgi:hypothetical protein